MLLEGKQLTKKYGDLTVLQGVDLIVEQGEIVTILGSSGAGKSTLLHILGTLDSPSSGEVWLQGQLISTLRGSKLAEFRNRHIGFIFQFHHLLPEFSALENVCIPGWVGRLAKKAQIRDRAEFLLNSLGLGDRKNHPPGKLSGGEQQRVAVARALINQPDIILADEPTGNLDSQHALELHGLFQELRNQFNQTFVIVTHNEALAELSDRRLVMKDGLMLDPHPESLLTK
ncbi:MAG: ABC transporter ATP-binding protein [Chitinophagaceae bacterium]